MERPRASLNLSGTLINTETQLESYLSEPTGEVIKAIAGLAGDILILGVGGKMGPTLAKQAKLAIERAGIAKKAIGVSRFSTRGVQRSINRPILKCVTENFDNFKKI